MPSSSSPGRIVQVSNVSQQASRDQMYTLFSFLGRVSDLKLYPTETNPYFGTYDRKICFVKFDDTSSAEASQHLSNTVLIDRALVVVPYQESSIPDETSALRIHVPILPGQRHLPATLINQITSDGTNQLVATVDPQLAAGNLPPYPTLPANTEAYKIEEIRRTIYVGDIPRHISGDEVVNFFSEKVGEVMYLKFAGDPDLPYFYAYIEFSAQQSVVKAMQLRGTLDLDGSVLRIQHSNRSVLKPMAKTAEMVQKEIEEAMAKAKSVSAGADNGHRSSRSPRRESSRYGSLHRSRSRSKDRASRSSRSRRSRSRERRRRRSRSDSKDRKKKSRSPSKSHKKKSKSRSPSRKTKRSRSREKKRRSRSKSGDRKKRSKSREKKRTKRESRSKSKEKKKRRKSSSKSPRASKEKESSSKTSEKSKHKESKKPTTENSAVKVKLEENGEKKADAVVVKTE